MNDIAIEGARLPGNDFAPQALAGLIWAYRFREGYAPESLQPGEVAAALAAEDGWLWLHFNLADRLAQEWIGAFEPLPEQARKPFLTLDETLGLHTVGHVIFGVIADFHGELGEETNNIGRLRFALSDRLVISGRRRPLQSVDEI